jgi:hypothetical protein
MRVIVTVVQELVDTPIRDNIPPSGLAGRMRLLCDDKTLMEPVMPEEDWDVMN